MQRHNLSTLEQILFREQSEERYDLSERIHFVTSDAFDKLWFATSSDEERDELSRQYKEVLGPVTISIYDDILDGDRSRFPPGTFMGEHGRLNAEVLVRHRVGKENKSKEDIPDLPATFFDEHKLSRVISICDNSHVQALIAAFPEHEFKPYYFHGAQIWQLPDGKPNLPLAREATLELYERLGRDPAYIPATLSEDDFRKPNMPYGRTLEGMLRRCFNGSPIQAVINAYPELRLQPHYFSRVPNGYWQGQAGRMHAREATQEVFKVLGILPEKLPEKACYAHFSDPKLPYAMNLNGMLSTVYKDSFASAIIDAYPEMKFKPSDFGLRKN